MEFSRAGGKQNERSLFSTKASKIHTAADVDVVWPC